MLGGSLVPTQIAAFYTKGTGPRFEANDGCDRLAELEVGDIHKVSQ